MKVFIKIFVLMFLFNSNLFSQYKNILIDDEGKPNEPSIAINPKNPAQLVAGSNISQVYFSNDTGKTWVEQRLVSNFGVWGDPSITVDTNGYFYFLHLSNADSWIDRIVCQRSIDAGKSWTQDTFMGYTVGKQQDKQWPVVDPINNNIYVSWTQFDKYGSHDSADSSNILFSKSIDSGKTWSKAKRINDTAGDCVDSDDTVEGAVPAVGPNGEVYVSWAGPLGLMFDKSLDQGETWFNDIFVSDIPGGWDYNIPGISRCNGLPITACDLSNGNNRGTIYINWSDQRNGENDTDIWLVKSTDGGINWSKPKRVNNDLPGKQQFLTWMTIDQTTGYLYFVFYDRRNYSNNNTDVYLAVSKNGGETFDNFKISESPFNPNKNIFFGDYTNITVTNGIIRPIWTRADNFSLSLWTALINAASLTTSTNSPEFHDDLFELYGNYPNPYTNETAVSFKLRNSEEVSLTIYDSLGNEVSKYINNVLYNSGKHIIVIDNKKLKLKAGMYLYSLKINNTIKSYKMIIE